MTDSEKLDLILSEVQGMKTELQSIREEMQDMKESLQEVRQREVALELTIENEFRANIRRAIEKHDDLLGKLHETMKINSEVEMLAIKTTILESDVRNLKARLA